MKPRRERRAVHGIVLLNKPVGLTSNTALQRVKHIFNAQKAGHTGNLDAPASGLLPICLGEATKITPFLLDADKEYIARIRFGARTDTADAAGTVIETKPVPPLSAALVDDVLLRFYGDIEQVPPMFSALKVDGQRLYRLAAQGISVERAARTINIRELERLALNDEYLEIRVRCSKGTYIRTLAEDIGAALGTVAHILTLHRSRVGPFQVEDALTLEELQARAQVGEEALNASLIAMDKALEHLPAVELGVDASHFIMHGQAVRASAGQSEQILRLYDDRGRFIGIGAGLGDGRVAPRRLLNLGA